MAAIGSLVFCQDCGNLLEPNIGRRDFIACEICGTQNRDNSNRVVVTVSKPSAFPSTLRTRLRSDVLEISEADRQADASVDQTCEKCGHDKARFYVQQLRSADEGSTIFYTCLNCRHKWAVNN